MKWVNRGDEYWRVGRRLGEGWNMLRGSACTGRFGDNSVMALPLGEIPLGGGRASEIQTVHNRDECVIYLVTIISIILET